MSSTALLAGITVAVTAGVIGCGVGVWWVVVAAASYFRKRANPIDRSSMVLEAADLADLRRREERMRMHQEQLARQKTMAGGGAGDGVISPADVFSFANKADSDSPSNRESVLPPPRPAYNEMSVAALERFGLEVGADKRPAEGGGLPIKKKTQKAPQPYGGDGSNTQRATGGLRNNNNNDSGNSSQDVAEQLLRNVLQNSPEFASRSESLRRPPNQQQQQVYQGYNNSNINNNNGNSSNTQNPYNTPAYAPPLQSSGENSATSHPRQNSGDNLYAPTRQGSDYYAPGRQSVENGRQSATRHGSDSPKPVPPPRQSSDGPRPSNFIQLQQQQPPRSGSDLQGISPYITVTGSPASLHQQQATVQSSSSSTPLSQGAAPAVVFISKSELLKKSPTILMPITKSNTIAPGNNNNNNGGSSRLIADEASEPSGTLGRSSNMGSDILPKNNTTNNNNRYRDSSFALLQNPRASWFVGTDEDWEDGYIGHSAEQQSMAQSFTSSVRVTPRNAKLIVNEVGPSGVFGGYQGNGYHGGSSNHLAVQTPPPVPPARTAKKEVVSLSPMDGGVARGLEAFAKISMSAKEAVDLDIKVGDRIVLFEAFVDGSGYGVNLSRRVGGLLPLSALTFTTSSENPDGVFVDVDLKSITSWRINRDIKRI